MNTQAAERPAANIRDLLVDAASLPLDQLPMLPAIFDRAGGNLAERLRGLSAALPHFTLSGVEGQRLGDALDSYDMRAIVGIVHVPAWDNRIVVGFDRDFIFTVIEMLFGGDGSEPPCEDVRNFSSIETQVAQFLFEQAGHALQTAFSAVSNARFRFERAETRMDFASAGRRNTPSVVARYILQAINRGGEMFVVVPQAALTPFRQALSRIVSREPANPDPAWVKQISDEVQRTAVTIHAVLESTDYTLGDIADLAVGQVLKLKATPRSRVKVESSEQPLFWAYLGQNEGMHTLCIDEPIDREQEFIADVLAR
jgi:flagellar motor switch protein FliM